FSSGRWRHCDCRWGEQMAERSFVEQLDALIDELLARPESQAPSENELAQIAGDLRELPDPQFKARLKSKLQRRKAMVATYVREGFHTVTPYVTHPQGAQMIDFVKQVFGAEETSRSTGGGGGIHCELPIGDSMLMMGGGGSSMCSAPLHCFV